MDTVSHTLFFPLLGRARASRKWPELFPDPQAAQAEEIAAQEKTPAQALDDFSTVIYGLRHRNSVLEAQRFLADHPGASVVNIGCGLDQLALELDTTVYNLDFPEVLKMRSRWIPKLDNEVDLPLDVTDPAWLEKVDSSRGVFLVAPGVFYYLQPDDVRTLLHRIGEAFPVARLSFDSESPFVTRMSEKMIAKKGTPCEMPFKVKDPRSLKSASSKISSVDVEFDLWKYFPAGLYETLPWGIRARFAALRWMKGIYQVTIDFGGK
ncbi:MAG: class I SAM-dependent methyltransferase [Corynebacterium sp.]|uniref:class I SAM-dependent methyltransferase n=1 Tax=Corynebacterium sp. TaxID=1720 RepID=UPI0026DABB90|nr:class I SAM-dependent methyltransferase [Corynebacterium sp.]MDO4761045.1 class I SAM-dependent methyltransferase [Corynebacterium sp.]